MSKELNRNCKPSGPIRSSLVTRHFSLLFVYGTLRRGFSRHAFLEAARARLISLGTIHGELFDLGDYPGAALSKRPRAAVHGELYRLPNPAQAFRVLDEVEGVTPLARISGEYRRDPVQVKLRNGRSLVAWVYWLNRKNGPRIRIHSGDYSRFRER